MTTNTNDRPAWETRIEENGLYAKMLCDALRKFASNPDAIDNFECYLSYHFDKWIQKYASDPAGLAGELKNFSEIDCNY